MSADHPDTMSRLRAANPTPVERDLGRRASAQAALQEILRVQAPVRPRRRRRLLARMPGGGVGLALVAVVGGGAALAATNPFGWWSANPDTARYAINPAAHVRTPTAAQIACRAGSPGQLVCAPGGSGQTYFRADSVRLPSKTALTRARLIKAIARLQAEHQLSQIRAVRIRADLAAVPDSFFITFNLGMRYQTIGSAGRVPPPGVPEFLVCQDAGHALSCQNLNGDRRAPIGAGIYMAQQTADWRPAPRRPVGTPLPPGIRFTAAESRLLIDLMSTVRATGGSSPPTRVAPPRRP